MMAKSSETTRFPCSRCFASTTRPDSIRKTEPTKKEDLDEISESNRERGRKNKVKKKNNKMKKKKMKKKKKKMKKKKEKSIALVLVAAEDGTRVSAARIDLGATPRPFGILLSMPLCYALA